METELEQIQEAPSRKKTYLLGISLVLFLIFLFGFLGLYLYTRDNGVIVPQITIFGIDISGQTLEGAKQRLADEVSAELEKEVELQIPGEVLTLKIQLDDLGLTYDLNSVLDQAWSIGRKGTLLSRASSKFEARSGLELSLKGEWDDQVLMKTLKETLKTYNFEPKDATFEITEDNQMLIHPEQRGREIDLEALGNQIQKLALAEYPFSPITTPLKSSTQPNVTAAQLEAVKFTGLIAKYTTSFDSSLLNRSENIRLAAKALDKQVLAPNELFSFNESVGERTADRGYKEALVIVGDTFTPGLGGGICQVSSTLYNAILLAHLQIIERHPHSLPVTYVPPGQDATVSYPVLDLKFKNSSSGYVLIRSSVQGSNLIFELYGK